MQLSLLIVGTAAVLSSAALAAPAATSAPPGLNIAANCNFRCHNDSGNQGSVGVWWLESCSDSNGKGGDIHADWFCNKQYESCKGNCFSVQNAKPFCHIGPYSCD
ncbi:hypothetical protein BDZ88DRAFT_304472 [Geranomyces variabilis]|nr:hypothetical protein BDZ88DRAFT_304472 [Geranomyces variabilis]KAJ3142078.1 hypothetical protein HDU90_004351 [Geranomyces variabilis]